MAACPICGAELPGKPAQCPICNADLANAGALMDDILGAVAPARPAAPAKPAERAPVPYATTIKAALLWGWVCAAVLAVVVGLLLHVIIGDAVNYTSLKSGLNFGAMLGFLIGSIWGATSVLETELGMSALVGAAIGAVDTTIHTFAVSFIGGPPDYSLYLYTIMGALADGAAGAFSVVLRSYREGQ